MFILHLFSNWKWTGPAEHATILAKKLKCRGHRVVFACGRPPGPASGAEGIEKKARELGLEFMELRLKKHFSLLDNTMDLFSLTSYIKSNRPDIVHTHLTNDHLLGGLAARAAPVPLLRTSYEGEGLKRTVRNRLLLRALTSGLITVSERARQEDMANFGLPGDRVWKVEVGVDTSRFSPRVGRPRLRKALGMGTEEVVVGVAARIQWHRRFDVFLEAFRLALRERPNLRAIILGRGTNMTPVAVEPSRRMGLNGKVVFPGYKEGEEYVDALASMDIKVFLMPGTDGSCRAVREAMAMGLPVIAARRGMLPEIVLHSQTGLVVEDTPENLAEAMLKLAGDESLRRRMGQASRQRALERFSLDKEAQEVEAIYQVLLRQ